MSDLPQIRSWRVAHGASTYHLTVDIDYVEHAETSPSPYSGGSLRVSYEEFLHGRGHSMIRDTFGDTTLNEALLLVGRNATLIALLHPD